LKFIKFYFEIYDLHEKKLRCKCDLIHNFSVM